MSPPSARAMPTKSPSLRITLPCTTHESYTSQARQSHMYPTTVDITRAAMEDFRQLFDMFDKNGDDQIDSTEFSEIVRMLGEECPSTQQLNHMIRVACQRTPQDATPYTLTFPQFMRFFAIYKQDWPTRVDDTDIFNVLDEDRGGTISPNELCKVLNRFGMRVTEDEANAMADFATPLPGPNEIAAADMAQVAQSVRQLRERKGLPSMDSDSEDD